MGQITIDVDFGDIPEYEAIPAGRYPGVIEAVVQKQADGSEFPYFEFSTSITQEGEHKGRQLTFRASLSPKAIWRLKQVCENLGVYKKEMSFVVDEETKYVTEPNFVGLPVVLVVSKGLYQGRYTNQVDDVLPAAGSGPKIEVAETKESSSEGPSKKKGPISFR